MSSVVAFARSPVTGRRVVFLLLGSAVALSFFLLDATLILLVTPHLGDWPTIAFAVAVITVPPVLFGMVSPVRRIEAVVAESLLGVTFPDGTPGPAQRMEQRVRSASWFVLHILAGGLVVVVVATLVPLALALFSALLSVPAGEAVSSIDWLRPTGSWADAWMPIAAVACLIAAVSVPIWLGALLARWASRLLGPSYAERLHRLEVETARLAERNRIARELHDSIGHALSLVTVQAVAARQLGSRDLEFVNDALETIESTSRSATADLDHMLGLLRAGEPRSGEATAPAPDLDTVDALVAATRAAGLKVRANVDVDLGRVPGVVSRETYRIIQEGLTNALRHSTDRSVHLEIERRTGRLLVTMTNPAETADPVRRGGGLRGLEERVHALGGSITNTVDSGTWRLAVELPLPKGGVA